MMGDQSGDGQLKRGSRDDDQVDFVMSDVAQTSRGVPPSTKMGKRKVGKKVKVIRIQSTAATVV